MNPSYQNGLLAVLNDQSVSLYIVLIYFKFILNLVRIRLKFIYRSPEFPLL